MKNKLKNIMNNMETKDYKVVRVNKIEFELENGDVYPHVFELDDDVSVEEFQKLLDLSKDNIINHMKKN
jgi:predicted CoA-binding protein